jgi:hypothetical protein
VLNQTLEDDGLCISFDNGLYDFEVNNIDPDPESEHNLAQLQLVALLLSEIRFKIAKCRNVGCERYFVLKYWRRAYKRGTRCMRCMPSRRREDSRASNQKSRGDLRTELHRAIAKKFAEKIRGDADWYTKSKLKTAISAYASRLVDRSEKLKALYPEGLTEKWVANFKNYDPINELALNMGRQ